MQGSVEIFPCVAIPRLEDVTTEDNENFIGFTLSTIEKALIVSVACVGELIGGMVDPTVRRYIGPKKTCLIVITGCLTLGYLLLAFATNVWMLYCGRVIMGFGLGIAR